MDETLEKVDLIRERTGLGYKEAKDLLDAHGNDVVAALVDWEQSQKAAAATAEPGWKERFQVKGEQLVDKVKELLREGNVTRIVIRKGDDVLVEIPVTWGAIGAVMAPALAAVGVVAALVSNCTIEVQRKG
ncbi:MAG TPA: DUF4342 domain-containing protein [Firmicutes bacterium]|nr:DUF4342 domain-containing protein [Bacillota bacterium]